MAVVISEPLPVQRAHHLEKHHTGQNWLIESVWSRSAVGMIGGAPKCCKSWFGLDMAVSICSATPCLDRFAVKTNGPALIFLAEDALPAVRSRIESLCEHRKIDIKRLDLFVITAPSLRLDLADDQNRLKTTLEKLRPRILILDPLVRLHRLDENSASDISSLLGFVRELQRTYDLAIVLVHHASKKRRSQPGQALRGSSDLHAFGDSNAYLARRKNRLILTLEHRAAQPPDPVELELKSLADGSQTHLEIISQVPVDMDAALTDRVFTLLNHCQNPMTRTAIRQQLKVNNQRLGHALGELDRKGLVIRKKNGWISKIGIAIEPASGKEDTIDIRAA